MTAMFKLRRLRAVLGVSTYGSTSRAAENLHMSQPSVTDAIAACEADFGVRLFERTSRGMEVTPAGAALCARIALAFGYLKAADDALRPRRGRTGASLDSIVTEGQLRALSAIIETGGFSPAARRLGLSQPTVHRAARDLEALCGTPLFQVRGGLVEATPEARTLARHADLCFAELARGLEDITEIQGIVEGRLTIGALPLARAKWLPDAVADVLRRYPMAQVHIMDGPYDEQLMALRHARIDFILGALRDPLPCADITQEVVFSDPVVIVVRTNHALAAGFNSDNDKLTPQQLGSLGWILPRTDTPGRRNFGAFLESKGLASPSRVIECSSLITTRALLLQSDYAAVLSRQQIEADVTAGYLKIMGPPLTGSARPIGITVRKGFRPTQLQAAFLDVIRRPQ